MIKVGKGRRSGFHDVTVCRRTYVCLSCPSFHKTLMTIKYGKDIQQWFPLVLLTYYFVGLPIKFEVRAHGNRKTENLAHVRTKQSTKERVKENLKKKGSKRALFQTVKQAGVCGAENPSSLPRNTRQAAHLRKKEEGWSSMHPTDPLAAILELQKSTFPGFIRDVTCNDLPTVMLFTGRQVDNLVKFCCLIKPGLVSELGVDLTFQLGHFTYLSQPFETRCSKLSDHLGLQLFQVHL